MTDEQIIKAVGICRTPDTCRGCPYHELYTAGCICALMKDVFDLIDRQKAEIERLKKNIDGLNIFTTNHMKVIRLQAIKEFAKYIIDKSQNGIIQVSDIPDYVKEMTEVQE